MTILVVDDNEQNRYQLEVLLSGNGYGVLTAAHGAEALIKARQTPPSLVISDLLMPVMDGYTFLRHWRADARLKRIPFIVYTATYTDERDRRFALSLGADLFVIKPEEPEAFLATVRQAIQQVADFSAAPGSVPIAAPPEEALFLTQYNATLIRKLEAKMEQLERANRELERDAAERNSSEERIRAQAALLDLAQDAIAVRDMNGCVTYWNHSCERLVGLTAAEAVGRQFQELLKPDRAVFDRATRRVLETGQWNGELNLTVQEGRSVIVMSRWTLVRDERGHPTSVLVISTDMTEQKKLEAQLLRAQRMESIGTLASGVAHDLNNILTPIMMAAPLLRDPAPREELEQTIAMIEANAQRGADIVKQLLTFGRGHSGERVAVQWKHLIKDLAQIARETFPKDILFDSKPAADLRLVMGDTTQLHQVLLNLCVNARDAMPHGGTLSVAAENVTLDEQYTNMNPEAKPGPYVPTQTQAGTEGRHLQRSG